MNEKVSVIIAMYNCENTIRKCIESIENQTYKNLEIIVCDDCSKDRSIEQVEKLKKEYNNIVLLKNEKNMRAAATRNKCIEKATGEYIAIQDADDYSHPNRLEKQINTLKESKDIDFVSTAMYRVNSKGIYGVIKPKQIEPNNKSFLIGSPYTHGSAMFRKRALEKVGGYNIEKKFIRVEDANLFMQLHIAGMRGKNIEEPLYYYMEDENAYSRRKYRYRISAFKLRWTNYKKMGLMPKGIVYAFRPLIVGLIPNKLAYFIKRKINHG